MPFQTDCRYFTGYKPCRFNLECTPHCPQRSEPSTRILVIALEAMGAVLRATCLLPAIQRKYPGAHVTWLTLNRSAPLLEHNPLIDRLMVLSATTSALLATLRFEIAFGVDKSLEAGALLATCQAGQKWGFSLAPSGAIIPASPEADYQYRVGLDDDLKFYRNTKTENQQLTETMGLPYARDPYVLELSQSERAAVAAARRQLPGDAAHSRAFGVIGFNTGCSQLFPYKKFTVERSCELIARWRQQLPHHPVVLCGGPEDFERQQAMKAAFATDPYVVLAPTDRGLRHGICWIDACDVVFSGCSLGMHLAIGLGKQVVAWFGVSCAQEIDLYGRGEKIQSTVSCAPCWKRHCSQPVKCYDQVAVDDAVAAVARRLAIHQDEYTQR